MAFETFKTVVFRDQLADRWGDEVLPIFMKNEHLRYLGRSTPTLTSG